MLEFTTITEFPSEVASIRPGCAIVFLPKDKESAEEELLQSVRNCQEYLSQMSRYFPLDIDFRYTDENILWNHIVARRVNLGTLDKYAVIVADISYEDNISYFFDEYYDLLSTDTQEVLFVEDPFRNDVDNICYSICMESEESECLDVPFGDFYEDSFSKYCKSEDLISDSVSVFKINQSRKRRKAEALLAEEEQEVSSLEEEAKAIMSQIATWMAQYIAKYHEVSTMEQLYELSKGKLLLTNNCVSDIVVNNNLDVVLPSYNEVVIPLPPLSKALYFLFLLHSEGIRLSDMPSHRKELEELYGLITPNRDDDLAKISIDLITDPIDNSSLRQQLSKIKRIFSSRIVGDALAANYYISGERGGLYKIPLDPSHISLPQTLKNQ